MLGRYIMLAVLVSILAYSTAMLVSVVALDMEEILKLGTPLVIEIPINGTIAYTLIDENRSGLVVTYYDDLGKIYVADYISYSELDKIRAEYPLQGRPLSASWDKLPSPHYIAIGTSYGELLVLDISSRNASYRYLQALRLPVTKARISIDGIAMALSEAGYLRLFNISESGWMEIGPIVGNAARASREGVYVYSGEMLLDLNSNVKSYRSIIATYESIRSFPSILIVKVMTYNATENRTIPAATAEGYIYSPLLGLFSPIVHANENGELWLPVPVPLYNATLFVKYNDTCFVYALEGLNIIEPGVISKLKPILLSKGHIGVCIEPIQTIKLEIYNISLPGSFSLKEVKRIHVRGIPVIHAFIKIPDNVSRRVGWSYILISTGTFPASVSANNTPVILLNYLDKDLDVLARTTWIPLHSDLKMIAFTSDAKYLALGFNDGRVLILGISEKSNTYKALWQYRMNGPITSMVFAERLGNNDTVKALIVLDSGGDIQVLAFNEKTLIPVLRIGRILTFSTGYGSSITASHDANIIIVSGNRRIVAILGLGKAATSSPVEPIDLSKAVARPLVILVKDAEGTPVANATIEIYRGRSLIFNRTTNNNGQVMIKFISPGEYFVVVKPKEYWLSPWSGNIVVPPGKGTYIVTVVPRYKPIKCSMRIIDQLTKMAPEELLNITVYRGSSLIQSLIVPRGIGNISFKLIKGNYTVIIEPIERNTIYKPAKVLIHIPGKKNITVMLERKSRLLHLILVDLVSKSPVKEPLNITILWKNRNIASYIVREGSSSISLSLPIKANISVLIEPLTKKGEPPLYKKQVVKISEIPPQGITKVVGLSHYTFHVALKLIDNLTKSAPLVPISIAVDGKNVTTLSPGTRLVILELDKGIHKIELTPLPGYGNNKVPLYSKVTFKLDAGKEQYKTIFLERAYARLTLKLIDRVTKTIPLDTIIVDIDGTTIATLTPKGNNTISIYLAKGFHELKALSKNKVYQPISKRLNLTKDTNLVIGLTRTNFIITLRIIDDTGAGVTGAKVSFTGLNIPFYTETISIGGEASVSLPYGTYHVCIDAPGFKIQCLDVDPTVAKQEVRIILSPYPLTILQRYIPLILAIAAIASALAILYRKRERIIRAIAPEEEIF